MQINNTYNQSFTAVKMNSATVREVLKQPQEIKNAISVAGKELEGTKHWHMHINQKVEPIITNEKGSAYTSPIVFRKPTGKTIFFEATSANSSTVDSLPFDYHSFFTFESPSRAVAEYNRLQAMSNRIERSAEMVKLEERRDLNRMLENKNEVDKDIVLNLVHDIK